MKKPSMKLIRNHLKSLIILPILGVAVSSCDLMETEESNLESNELYSATGSISPNLLHYITFEESDPFAEVHKQLAEDHSFGVSSNAVLQDIYSGRFELRDSDDLVANGTRAEVLFPDQSHNERWYSYSLYLPSDGFKIDSDSDIISQWHQGSGSGSPTTTLRVGNDRFFLKSGATKEARVDYDIAAVKKDTWNEFVFHIVHSSGDDGLVEVWLNGEKALTINGGNMDKDFGLPRWKIGIYKNKWNYKTTDTDLRVLYFDNVRMGDENAIFEEMTSLGSSVSTTDGDDQLVESTVNGLTLINTSSDEAIGDFGSGAEIIAKDHRLSIIPNFGADNPTEVRFELSGTSNRSYVDTSAPFSLNGDNGDSDYYYGEGLYPGEYELLVTPYFEVNGAKVSGTPALFTFTISEGKENLISLEGVVEPEVPEITISYLTLINTSSDEAIGNFGSGAQITAKDHRLSIVPDFGTDKPLEVRFDLSGASNRSFVDSSAPFALNGDNGDGDYWFGEGLYPGDYELLVTPYVEVNGEKVEGTPELFTFTIEEGKLTLVN